jgi:pimeloyl-ACP methyl ester carboxylesterase
VSTVKSLEMPDHVRSVAVATARGSFAALQAQPTRGVCERRPALLVHGYTGSKEDFLPVLQPLAAAGRMVVAIDLRGQYQSPHASGRSGYAPDQLAADVLAVADALSASAATPLDAGGSRGVVPPGPNGGVHLVGHSMGGLIAREAVLQRACGFLSLTLLGSGPAAIAGQRAVVLGQLLELLDPDDGQTGDDLDQLRTQITRIWHEQLAPQAREDGTDEHIIAFLRERTLRTCPVSLIVLARYLLTCQDRTDELAAAAAAALIPITVIYGENDDAWLPAVQARMARRLSAERACIPGAAHSPAVEAPDTTASMLTTFWNSAERHRPVKSSRSQAG